MKFFAEGYSAGADTREKPDIKARVSSKDLLAWLTACSQRVTSVTGPEPGYVATPIFLVQSALTSMLSVTQLSVSLFDVPCLVLGNVESLPKGVLTTATAFRDTDIIERLSVKRNTLYSGL